MTDLLKRKPSLAELTGITETRLDRFATFLRAYLVGSTVTNTRAGSVVSMTPSSDTSVDSSEFCQNTHFAFSSSKPSRPRHYGSQGAKPNPFYQGSLSPRSSSFKEGLVRNLSSLRSVAREKFRRRGESHLSCVDNLSVAPPSITDASSSNEAENSTPPESIGTCLFPSSSFLDSLGKSTEPPFLRSASPVPSMGSSFLSPYYCWCPPVASTLQYTVAPPQLPISSTESLSFPPLPSLLSSSRSSSLLTPMPPLNLSEIPSLDFPPFLPEPLVRLPFSMPISQQIPTFTPLMCDPIVHLPVIEICSSGQGYLVSAGPAISTTIPPLHPTLVSPLIKQNDSMVEKGARETLRLLLGSSGQTSPQLMSVLPSVLTNSDESQNILAAGRRGIYSGARDVGTVANSIAAMGFVSLSERCVGSRRCISQGDLVDQLEKPGGSGGSCPDDEGSFFSSSGEGRTG